MADLIERLRYYPVGIAVDAADEIDRLQAALKKIEDLALNKESPAHRWGVAFAIATHALHPPVSKSPTTEGTK